MAEGGIEVCVAWSPGPRQVEERLLQLPAGSTVVDALRASGVASLLGAQALDTLELAIWGRRAQPGDALRERDRVELLRPLRVDPKVARRERFSRQGVRAAGLFAKRRR